MMNENVSMDNEEDVCHEDLGTLVSNDNDDHNEIALSEIRPWVVSQKTLYKLF